VFENRVLRKILGPAREGGREQGRDTLRSFMIDTPHQMYFSCDKTEKNKMGGACSTCGKRRHAYRGLVKKPQG
jgi:hypothetical protein